MPRLPHYFTRKFFLCLLLAAIALSVIGNALTFAISKTQKVAADAVFRSTAVQAHLGKVDSVLLIGSSSTFSGPRGCMDFNYLVFGEKGVGLAGVRAETGNSPKYPTRVREVAIGLGGNFNTFCWDAR